MQLTICLTGMGSRRPQDPAFEQTDRVIVDEPGRFMFQPYEDQLRGLIKKAHAPVLGLLGGLLPSQARLAIANDVRVTPGARAFVQRLDQFPALFGVWLAEHVMHGLGGTGHYDVYPHVYKAIGSRDPLNADARERLWRAFRRALLKVGIQPLPRTSGTHFMTDEFVRQAGVPLAFADDLALKMLSYAKRLGIPDEDDQEGLLNWQASLLNRLNAPFSGTARKAVERDTQGYYTRAFLRVFANHGQPTSGDALEAALGKAFLAAGGTTSIRRAAIPQLMYRDGVLGVQFPPGAAATYELRCDDTVSKVRCDEAGTFRPLPMHLPAEVTVVGSDGERLLSTNLWADRASNRFLLFNDAGRLRGMGQLNQVDPIELAPGRYVALCRFSPTNIELWEEVSEDPQLIEVLLDIRPGTEMSLANGAAAARIVGTNQPTFRVNGLVKSSLDGLEFNYGAAVADVEIPTDWLHDEAQLFEVRASAIEATTPVRFAVSLKSDGTGSVDLAALIGGLGLQPGLRRVVVELARLGDARAMQRQSILYWVGLSGITYGLRFSYGERPKNLVMSACSGLRFDERSAEPASDMSRVVRVGFDMGSGRSAYLAWNRPGIFVDVEIPTRDGSMSRLTRSLGSNETVSLTQHKNIIVSASEPGYLTLGEWTQFVDFAHRPSRSLAGSFLASRLEPAARTLTYRVEGGSTEAVLLHLSQPHVVSAIATSKLGNVFEVRLTLRGEPTGLALHAREVCSGREAKAEIEIAAGEWRTNDFARMQVYCAPAGAVQILHLLMDCQTITQGAWVLRFEAKIGGAWGRLEDGDEGQIGTSLVLNQVGEEVPTATLVSDVETIEVAAVFTTLRQLSEHFQTCWSASCSPRLSWLGLYWSALLERCRDKVEGHVTQLVDMATPQPRSDIRAGWQPRQSIGAQLPAVFALQRMHYKRVNIKSHPLSVALLAMPKLAGSMVSAFGDTLHPVSAAAFDNFAEVSRGKRPRHFLLAQYLDTLRRNPIDEPFRLDDESFVPQAGELLGPMHLAHAWRDLERGYARSMLMEAPRKALAASVSHALYQRRQRFDQAAPKGLQEQPLVLTLLPVRLDDMDDAEKQRHENLVQLANTCAWFAWYCRLEPRQPGSLAEGHERLTTIRNAIPMQGPNVSDCLAHYLHVAPAMFAFYLLLWELVLTAEMDPIVQHA